MYKVS